MIWFAVLERARRTADPALARQARRRLARLGIRVSYGRDHHATATLPLADADLDRIAARVADLLQQRGT